MATSKSNIDYYKNMSNDEFEIFCQRLMTLHKTGVYIAPPPKPQVCNNKKRAKKSPREYIPQVKQNKTTFGKGRVGVSCESYGVKNCQCCQPDNAQRSRVLRNVLNNQTCQTSEMYETQVQEIITRSKKIKPTVRIGNTIVSSTYVIDTDSEDDHKISNILGDTICLNSSNEFDNYDKSLIIIDNENNCKPPEKLTINKNTKFVDEIVIFDSDSDDDKKYVLNKSKPDKLRTESKMLLQKLMNNVKENENPSLQHNSDKASASESIECPICMEPLANKEIMSTICGHLFCSSCIQTSIRATKCCPKCRKKLTLKSIHPIFL